MFWENFFSLCKSKNTSPLQVVKELAIATGSITKWKNGSIPRGNTLQKLADYFGVSVDYLLGKTDSQKSQVVSLNEKDLQSLEESNSNPRLVSLAEILKDASPSDINNILHIMGTQHTYVNVFGDRLRQLRYSRNLSQELLAEELNISVRSLQKYESHHCFPTFEILITIADFFDVSLDYLAGRTNNPCGR